MKIQTKNPDNTDKKFKQIISNNTIGQPSSYTVCKNNANGTKIDNVYIQQILDENDYQENRSTVPIYDSFLRQFGYFYIVNQVGVNNRKYQYKMKRVNDIPCDSHDLSEITVTANNFNSFTEVGPTSTSCINMKKTKAIFKNFPQSSVDIACAPIYS